MRHPSLVCVAVRFDSNAAGCELQLPKPRLKVVEPLDDLDVDWIAVGSLGPHRILDDRCEVLTEGSLKL